MLETVREYASERLREDPEAERLAARGLARYCLAFLPRHIPPYPSDVHQARRLSAEQDNLRTALRWARHDGDPELLCQLAIGFAGSAGLVVTPGEAEDWLLRAQEFAEGTSFGTALLVMRAIAAGASGRFDRGAQLLEALPAKDAQNPAWYAAGLGSKALLMSLTGGAAEDVRTTAQLSVDAAREHGNRALRVLQPRRQRQPRAPCGTDGDHRKL